MELLNTEIARINTILEEYDFSKKDSEIFLQTILPIVKHEEFLKRLNPEEYPHHGSISLGSHIINDAILTYVLTKKAQEKNKGINVHLAVIIAMFHDLYELAWQNKKIDKKYFTNKHGFTHPIEAVINSALWYPEYYKNPQEKQILIDSIVHHMFPLPVKVIPANLANLELNNYHKWNILDEEIKKLLIETTNRNKINKISFARSKYLEGRIMSKADKIVSLKKDLKSLRSYVAFITGKNKELSNYKKK